jgi:hypothetical protein
MLIWPMSEAAKIEFVSYMHLFAMYVTVWSATEFG